MLGIVIELLLSEAPNKTSRSDGVLGLSSITGASSGKPAKLFVRLTASSYVHTSSIRPASLAFTGVNG